MCIDWVGYFSRGIVNQGAGSGLEEGLKEARELWILLGFCCCASFSPLNPKKGNNFSSPKPFATKGIALSDVNTVAVLE